MSDSIGSQRIYHANQSLSAFMDFVNSEAFIRRAEIPDLCDFALGNPQEMPLEGFTAALQRWSVPQDKDWFAYKLNEPEARETAAQGLRRWRGVEYDPEDIYLTNGAFAAIAVVLSALLDPGDEVIFISPPWFFYEPLILSYGGVPVRVKVNPQTMEPDLESISAALSPRTRAIIINTPNNPTGKIYSEKLLRELSSLLNQAQKNTQRPVYLLSDEAYSRIVYDGREFISPTTFYPHSLLLYTYGKTLLTPGQRIGYIVLPPEMPERKELGEALFTAQMLTGYAFPNALLQHALGDLDTLSIDIGRLQAKRDRLVSALRGMGYELHVPEGTFYLLVRSPIADDIAFTQTLYRHKILCLQGTVVEMPGYFRISLTASEDMIERSLPGFQAAIDLARRNQPAGKEVAGWGNIRD